MKHRSLLGLSLLTLLLLLAYFIYREWAHPWLLNGFQLEDATAQDTDRPSDESGTTSRQDGPTPGLPEPHDSSRVLPSSSAPQLARDLEKRLFAAQASLAQAMEEQLAGRLQQAHAALESRQESTTAARQTIAAIIERIRERNTVSAGELSQAIAGVESDLSSLGALSIDLTAAQEAWRETVEALDAVGEVSARVLDERNYRFEEYRVPPNQTLSQIARSLEIHYGIRHANLLTLIPLFNDVVTRPRSSSGRRSPMPVVTNPSLRIPIPKGAQGMLEDSNVSGSLQAQRQAMQQAQDRYEAVESSLHGHLADVRAQVQRVQGLEDLIVDLERGLSTLDTDEAALSRPTISSRQREAWEAFNRAAASYSQTDSPELQRNAAGQLEDALERLISSYQSVALLGDEAVSPESDDADELGWFLQFIEAYDPTDNGSTASPQ